MEKRKAREHPYINDICPITIMKHPCCAQAGHSIRKIRIWRESKTVFEKWRHIPSRKGRSREKQQALSKTALMYPIWLTLGSYTVPSLTCSPTYTSPCITISIMLTLPSQNPFFLPIDTKQQQTLSEAPELTPPPTTQWWKLPFKEAVFPSVNKEKDRNRNILTNDLK